MARRLFIHTFGCQANEIDSARMAESLAPGYEPTADPAEADLIVLNTCAIREKAVDKVRSAIGRYRLIKHQRGALIGVGGCVAQAEKEKLLTSGVDFVFGTDAALRLPELVARAERGERLVEADWIDTEEYLFPRADPEAARGKATAFVTAMKGCDNVCSFCVVPYTRGREVSRPYPQIVAEVRDLVAVGVREVTLVGQNVNSYAGGCTFADLLGRVAEVPGLLRIRFTTSHPQDTSPELARAFAEVDKLMPHFHLPVQSGSDRILALMRRRHTVAEYLEKVATLRAIAPQVVLTSDIIVGFPSETEEDFQATLELVKRVGFENLYAFIYSPRPNTGAARHVKEWGEVPREVAVERLERLQALQRELTLAALSRSLGSEVEVLVEGPSKHGEGRLFGRTPENRGVHFDGTLPPGSLARVRVESATVAALTGTLVSADTSTAAAGNPPRRRAERFRVIGDVSRREAFE